MYYLVATKGGQTIRGSKLEGFDEQTMIQDCAPQIWRKYLTCCKILLAPDLFEVFFGDIHIQLYLDDALDIFSYYTAEHYSSK